MSESYPVHDAYGNVCEIRRADAPVVALLWGYNYSRPVAIVEGRHIRKSFPGCA